MKALLWKFALKNPNGEPAEPTCQSSVGFFVLEAFGYHAFQSGSSLTFESIPIPRRFRVMIWSEATQSDQPEMTWMSSDTASPFGSMSWLPLYVNPASVSSFFAAAWSYLASAAASDVTFASVTHCGKRSEMPISSVGAA